MKLNLILQPETWCWQISEIKMYWNSYLKYFTLKVNEIGKFVVSASNETSIRHIGPEPFNSMFKEMKSTFCELQFCGLLWIRNVVKAFWKFKRIILVNKTLSNLVIRSVEWWQLYWRQSREIDWYLCEIKWSKYTLFW